MKQLLLACLATFVMLNPVKACSISNWPCFETSLVQPVRFAGAISGSLPSTVRTALARVASACSGFKVVSTYRKGARIRGTGRRSLHSYGLAADFRVNNYGCALKILASSPGIGYSKDGSRCRHLHVSDGSRVGRHEPRGFRHGSC